LIVISGSIISRSIPVNPAHYGGIVRHIIGLTGMAIHTGKAIDRPFIIFYPFSGDA
jgi:hypothetical protein